MALIVFTHGLGADEGFWGSTIDALRSHERLADHEIKAWAYRTSKRPGHPVLARYFQALRGWRHQDISEIGEELWSHLRSWSDSHNDVILVGHSMGGLVTAAALVSGFSSGRERDTGLSAKLRGILCIASPFAGASSAERLTQLYKRVGANQHIADLAPDSKTRIRIVQEFTRTVLGHDQLTFILMRAGDDAVVLPGEITNPFSRDQYLSDVLTGGHSECIRDLASEHPNFVKLLSAIEGMLGVSEAGSNTTEISLFRGRSVRIKAEYDDRLTRMTSNLDVLAWGLASFREDYGDDLLGWAARGIRIRLLLVDPNSPQGKMLCDLQDDVEGRAPGSTASDVATFLAAVRPVQGSLEVRTSSYHPGINMFRVDENIFFGPYLAPSVSRNAPTAILSNRHWLYDRLLTHFDWLWENATVA